MALDTDTPLEKWQRKRGNRLAGRVWLIVILICLSLMEYAASLVAPFLGSYCNGYRGVLIIATFWNLILIVAIWLQQGWARFALAAFLLCFVALHALFIPEALLRYPILRGDCMKILVLFCTTNALAAAFLLSCIDIRWLSRPGGNKND